MQNSLYASALGRLASVVRQFALNISDLPQMHSTESGGEKNHGR